jgi:uncharacterized repeat protein (TIGR02543 family)
MTGNLTVIATFTQDTYYLTMNTVGNGDVQPGNASYLSGTVVKINATNAKGWTFDSWSGAASGAANTTITMDGNLTITATFTQNTYYLTTLIVGNGTVPWLTLTPQMMKAGPLQVGAEMQSLRRTLR